MLKEVFDGCVQDCEWHKNFSVGREEIQNGGRLNYICVDRPTSELSDELRFSK